MPPRITSLSAARFEERGDQSETGCGIPIALAVMVLAIILQFNSFRRTFLTFMSIPLILIGIPVGLLATGQPLSFFGTLGIISLSGIIINNAIVLIDQIDIEREMLPLREAVVAASQKRLRPILLTSATTVLGLAPLAIAGGALWQPMAVLMMSGLAVASLLTLFFVPAGYFLLFWFDKDPQASLGVNLARRCSGMASPRNIHPQKKTPWFTPGRD